MAKRLKTRKETQFDGEALLKRTHKAQMRSKNKTGITILKPKFNTPDIIWTPEQKKTHVIDVVSYIAGKNDMEPGTPAYNFPYAYHKVGPKQKWMICPLETFDKPCPICEHRQRLIEQGKPKDVYKVYFPKKRNLYNVNVRSNPKLRKKVLLLDVSSYYFEDPIGELAIEVDEDTGDERPVAFAHPNRKMGGQSVQFKIQPAKGEGDYPKWVGHKLKERSYNVSEKILKQAFILDELVYCPSYKELKDEFYRGKVEDEDDGGTEEREDMEDLLEELDDIEDIDELKEFIEDNDIDFKIKKKKNLKTNIRLLREHLDSEEEEGEEDEDVDDSDMDYEDPEEEGEEEEPEYEEEDILEMEKDELIDLIEEEDLKIKTKGKTKKKLQRLVIKKLKL